jgi:hypothetical protein
MRTIKKPIDWRRFHNSRELAGEWRILRAKIRHVVDRTFALVAEAATDDDAADAIETLRVCALDYIEGKPFRVPPIEVMHALALVAEVDPAHLYGLTRAA